MQLRSLSCAALGLVTGLGWAASTGCLVCNGSVCTSLFAAWISEPDGEPLHAGTYVFEVESDGELEAATCEVSEGGASISCEGAGYWLSAPRFGHPENPHDRFYVYYEDEPPAQYAIRIVHDGETILDESLAPDYQLSEPGCDDDCFSASANWTLQR